MTRVRGEGVGDEVLVRIATCIWREWVGDHVRVRVASRVRRERIGDVVLICVSAPVGGERVGDHVCIRSRVRRYRVHGLGAAASRGADGDREPERHAAGELQELASRRGDGDRAFRLGCPAVDVVVELVHQVLPATICGGDLDGEERCLPLDPLALFGQLCSLHHVHGSFEGVGRLRGEPSREPIRSLPEQVEPVVAARLVEMLRDLQRVADAHGAVRHSAGREVSLAEGGGANPEEQLGAVLFDTVVPAEVAAAELLLLTQLQVQGSAVVGLRPAEVDGVSRVRSDELDVLAHVFGLGPRLEDQQVVADEDTCTPAGGKSLLHVPHLFSPPEVSGASGRDVLDAEVETDHPELGDLPREVVSQGLRSAFADDSHLTDPEIIEVASDSGQPVEAVCRTPEQ